MESKIEFIKENLNLAILLVLFIKLVVWGFNWTDCFASFVLLSFVNVYKVVGYLYPKRHDVHTDLENLNLKLNELSVKNEELNRDVTALAFERGIR